MLMTLEPPANKFLITSALDKHVLQDEHHPLLRPSLFQPALSLSGAASLARVDSSFGMRALEKLNPQGAPTAKR